MCSKKVENAIKKGRLYEDVRSKLRPFDPLFFHGNDFVSSFILDLEKFGNKVSKEDEFSHVGMVVTSDILHNELVKPGKIYVWESTISGRLGQGVNNIHGKAHLGVQLRDFDELIGKYDAPNDTRIAYGTLINNPLDLANVKDIKDHFTPFFNTYDNRMYDANLYSLFSAICKPMRKWRPWVEKMCHTEDWLFCSELLAMTYNHMGVYSPSAHVNPKDVIPRDIAYPSLDIDEMPTVVSKISYITTQPHYNPIESNQP
jgi:hypothetical protein